eukprot:789397_1
MDVTHHMQFLINSFVYPSPSPYNFTSFMTSYLSFTIGSYSSNGIACVCGSYCLIRSIASLFCMFSQKTRVFALHSNTYHCKTRGNRWYTNGPNHTISHLISIMV